MNTLKAGFARVNITPMMGIQIAGYYKTRIADGVLDDLEANALAVEAGGRKAVIISVDHCGLRKEFLDPCRKAISAAAGIPYEAVMVTATHTHTGPVLNPDINGKLEDEYAAFLFNRLIDAAAFAIADLRPAQLGYAVGSAPHISFVRRYVMKDGSIRTNPGVNNPEIDHPTGAPDERVNILRFNRGGAGDIVLVNFGCHPDVVGGNKISGDWPHFLRQTVEKAIDGSRCLFINGAQGDVNHVNVFPKGGDFNDMFNDFDGVSRGYGHARHMGRVVAGAVLQVYDKVEYVGVESIDYIQRTVNVASQMPSPDDDIDVAEAHRIHDLHKAGKDEEIPYKAMMLTTMVAQAERIVRLEHGPESFPMYLSAIAIGDFVIFGLPGEPFTGIGLALKETPGWKLVLPSVITNANEGYFPMMASYQGYEAKGSNFRKGVAEFIIKEGQELLGELRQQKGVKK